jgi:hypothetical protein
MQRFGEASPNAPQTPAAAGGFFPQAEIDRARQASVLPALNAPANAMDAGNWLVRNFGSGSGGPPQVARQPAAPSISPAVPNTSYQGYIPGGFDYMRQDPMTMGSSGSTDTLVGGAGAGADRLATDAAPAGDEAFNTYGGTPRDATVQPAGDPGGPGVVPAGDPPPGAAGASAGDLERGNPYFAGGRGPMARAPIGTQYVGAPKPKGTFADRAVPALAGMTPGIGLILAPILRSAMRTGSFDNAQSYRGPIQGRNYATLMTSGGVPALTDYGTRQYSGPNGISNSPFTPQGYTAPNFNPISGGPTYSYQPNGQGGGSYVDSQGRVHQY